MKWLKRISGLLFALLFARLGVLSLIHEKSLALNMGRGASGSYDVIGWKALVMGVGWIGAALCVFSLCCLGEKLEKERWNLVGAKIGAIVFGGSLCVVALATVANMMSRSAF